MPGGRRSGAARFRRFGQGIRRGGHYGTRRRAV